MGSKSTYENNEITVENDEITTGNDTIIVENDAIIVENDNKIVEKDTIIIKTNAIMCHNTRVNSIIPENDVKIHVLLYYARRSENNTKTPETMYLWPKMVPQLPRSMPEWRNR